MVRSLAAWVFDDGAAAGRGVAVLARLFGGGTTGVDDAALARWDRDRPRPTVYHVGEPLAADPVGGLFWGAVFGALPLGVLGTAAPEGALTGIGVPDGFVAELGASLRPGTSALLTLADTGTVGPLHDALAALRPRLLFASLSPAHDAAIREMFAPHPVGLP